jgi:hypothetical protein
MYTSSGRSPGLNGCLFVHFARARSSTGSSERGAPRSAPGIAPPTPRPLGGLTALYNPGSAGARSSVGERSLHTREVAGSKPAAPTRDSRVRSDSPWTVPIGARTPPSVKAFRRVWPSCSITNLGSRPSAMRIEAKVCLSAARRSAVAARARAPAPNRTNVTARAGTTRVLSPHTREVAVRAALSLKAVLRQRRCASS